ncbi:hypothetical protein HPB50_004762 [Hyalomma asiaticum]|uniref:Uncharacterized protein n=1 Tax=Hyalomma asiaticum TaxID=266040 RepID=A0ACB7S954_HYAAI|nr:hypothetical protein HPB50_004762 [Hyalomma asiaticum]
MSVVDSTRMGRPATSQSENNVARIREIVQQGRAIMASMLSDALDISKKVWYQILRKNLGKQKLNAGLVPRFLTRKQQKDTRASVSSDLHLEAEKDAAVVNRIIAEARTWCFQYDPQTNRQSTSWLSTSSPASSNERRQKTKRKTMLIDATGVMLHKLVLERHMVNDEF